MNSWTEEDKALLTPEEIKGCHGLWRYFKRIENLEKAWLESMPPQSQLD